MSSRPPWRRYALAIGTVFAAWSLREAITPLVGPTALPYITFFPAVAWAAWYGGLGPALVAIAASLLTSSWFFQEPLGSFRVDDPAALVAFPLASGFIVAAIEAMHRARRELVRSRDLLSTTLASIGDAVIVTDAHGRVTFQNAEAERLTGWPDREARGHALDEVFRIVNETTRAKVESPVDKVIRAGTVVGLANHTVLLGRHGVETPIDDSAAPVRKSGEELLGVVLVFRDVRAQRAAAEAQQRLAAIVDASGDAILSKDLDGVVRTWNASATRLFGWRAEEIVGKSITVLVPPERADEERELLDRLRAGRGTTRLQTVRLARDGRRIDVSVTNSALRDPHGEIYGASTVFHDLTDVVAAKDAIAREKELLETTLSSIGDAVIATDVEGRVTFTNAIARAMTGWSSEESAGRPLADVFAAIDAATRTPIEDPAARAMRERAVAPRAGDVLLVSRAGREIPIDHCAAPITGASGRLAGSVLVFRDVTERRAAERGLREADRRKNEFLATLAHELRNPLSAIKNGVTLLKMKGAVDPDVVGARDVIDRQSSQMSRLLDDLLDVNRLGRQKLELRKTRTTLAAVIANGVETARPAIVAGRHALDVRLPEEEIALDADPVRLAQVFSNLLNNAAKYMDAGGRIELDARREGSTVVASVRDHGIGIDAEFIPQLFEMFAQVPESLSRAQGGVGIGLALAKGLVELHGGTISAHSDGPGKGSTFTVRLPIAETGAAVAPARVATPRETVQRRVLIADDVRDNADMLAKMLRTLGHDVHVAYDGERAVEVASAVRPDVALLDIGMPKLDGYAVCRRIRAQPWGKAVYVIAQTGWGQESDLREAEEAGFDKHMLKPVDGAALEAVLDALPRPPRDA